jgi:dTDP-4-dehydrorhamnose reductase
MQKILILGVSGMLGSSAYRLFAGSAGFSVTGTARSLAGLDRLTRSETSKIIDGIDVADTEMLVHLFNTERPSVVVNCVGVIKQIAAAKDPLVSIAINALLPHRLASLCAGAGARLIQISTDCVFNGRRGGYRESDMPDAEDLYGRTKLLGEVDYPNAVTLRTSIIGHELQTSISLVDWFLSRPGPTVQGYRKAIYSGLPTIELARVIRDIVIPLPQLTGLWHVASEPINKYELLRLVADIYEKKIEILPDDTVAIDRSLDGTLFREATGYVAPPWRELITVMHGSR